MTDAKLEPVHEMRLLTSEPASSQRELASRLRWSLSETNYLVQALVQKGFVKANNFHRSDNKVAYAYLLAPQGIKKKLQLTHSFLIRKEREFVALQQEIEALRAEIETKGSR